MFGSGWEALPDVREWSDGPNGCPGVVARPSLRSGSCREAIPDVRRPFRMSGCGRMALPDVREWSVDTSGCPETLPDVREWSGGPPGRSGEV